MAEVRLNVFFKDRQSKEFKQVLSQINPNASDDKLRELVDALNSLTTNQVKEVWRAVEDYLQLEDDDFVTVEDIKKILAGTYQPVAEDNPVTDADIQVILSGRYSPVADDDSWSADDFVF